MLFKPFKKPAQGIFDPVKNQMIMRIRLILFLIAWVSGMLFSSFQKTVTLFEEVTEESGMDYRL